MEVMMSKKSLKEQENTVYTKEDKSEISTDVSEEFKDFLLQQDNQVSTLDKNKEDKRKRYEKILSLYDVIKKDCKEEIKQHENENSRLIKERNELKKEKETIQREEKEELIKKKNGILEKKKKLLDSEKKIEKISELEEEINYIKNDIDILNKIGKKGLIDKKNIEDIQKASIIKYNNIMISYYRKEITEYEEGKKKQEKIAYEEDSGLSEQVQGYFDKHDWKNNLSNYNMKMQPKDKVMFLEEKIFDYMVNVYDRGRLYLLNNLMKLNGFHFPETKEVFVKSSSPYPVATAVHELIHYYSTNYNSDGSYKNGVMTDKSTHMINEAITELHTNNMMGKDYPKTAYCNYTKEMRVMQNIEKVFGKEILEDVYYQNRLELLKNVFEKYMVEGSWNDFITHFNNMSKEYTQEECYKKQSAAQLRENLITETDNIRMEAFKKVMIYVASIAYSKMWHSKNDN